jgi:exonuclease SbcC
MQKTVGSKDFRMIERIELWDFESHEHSILDGFSNWLNLIYGPSDSGKTGIVRAIKLVAYNNFDPRSVRVGAKNCKVRIDTDRGYVLVTRGTDNIWEVCRKGEQPRVFSNIGKKILPEATEILGLNLVQLGDISLPVNIMNQDEGHFMLKELGGKDSSGSTRAQIVDEISGLSGIETVIKEVSLDRHRFGRAVKEHEDRAIEIRSGMHDVSVLNQEDLILTKSEELVSLSKEAEKTIENLANIFQEHDNLLNDVSGIEKEMSCMPNTRVVGAILNKVQTLTDRIALLSNIHSDFINISRELELDGKEIAALSNLSEIQNSVSNCEDVFRRYNLFATNAENIFREHSLINEELEVLSHQLSELPDLHGIPDLIEKGLEGFSLCQSCNLLVENYSQSILEVKTFEKSLQDCEKEEFTANQLCKDLMLDIDVCPLTLQPITEDCLKKIS